MGKPNMVPGRKYKVIKIAVGRAGLPSDNGEQLVGRSLSTTSLGSLRSQGQMTFLHYRGLGSASHGQGLDIGWLLHELQYVGPILLSSKTKAPWNTNTYR